MFAPLNPQPSGIKQEPAGEEAGYETDEYYDEQGRKVVEIDYSKIDADYSQAAKQYHVQDTGFKRSKPPKPKKKKYRSFATNEIRYTMNDMTPTIWDPRCSSNTDLACFWPVYVGNFKGNNLAHYFASHGLHVRWWFRKNDGYYRTFQRRAELYDMLVYFVSERDAKLAIELCHRDKNKGYKLNVFPGREPVYFEEDRSVYVKNMKGGHIFSEHFFEQHVNLTCHVKVNCVVKFDVQNGALEFENPGDVLKVQETEKMWTFMPVEGKLQKQRFLEKDVIQQIEAFLIERPRTLMVNKNDWYVKLLLKGRRPFAAPNMKPTVFPMKQHGKALKKLCRKYGIDEF